MPKLPEHKERAIWDVIRSADASFEGLARVAGLRPEADFRFVVLRNVDFAGSDLSHFDFTGVHFERCSFAGARVGTATFTGAKFDGASPEDKFTEVIGPSDTSDDDASATEGSRPASENEFSDAELAADRLEADLSSRDWPLMFRRAWLAYGPDKRLFSLAQRWLDEAPFAQAVWVLVQLLSDPRIGSGDSSELQARASHLVHEWPATEMGWSRLWRVLLRVSGHRSDLLHLGASNLATVTQAALHLGSSRRLEKTWTDIWAQLLRHSQDGEAVAHLARGAAEVFTSSEFAVDVLSHMPHSPHSLWAIERLEGWLFSKSAPNRKGFKIIDILLAVNPAPNVITIGLNWLVAADPKTPLWPRVWRSLAHQATGEYVLAQGVKWLSRVEVATPGWADVLAEILRIGAPPDGAAHLQLRAAEWLNFGRPHPSLHLISEFARSAPASSQATPTPSAQEKRAEVIGAFERHFGVRLRTLARNRFATSDQEIRAVFRTSKRYQRFNGPRYWYSYYETSNQFLATPASFLVLGCMDRQEAYAIPAEVLRTILPYLHQTHGSTSSYWHIDLIEAGGEMALLIPNEEPMAIGEFQIPL